MTAIRLGYDKVRCDRCGDRERVLGIPCATCGDSPGPSEVNHQVQRRRRLVAALRTELESVPAAGDDEEWRSLADLGTRVASDFDGLLAALKQSSLQSEPFADGTLLAKAVRAVAQTRQRLSAANPLRPHLSQLELLRDTGRLTEEMCVAYLLALEAPSPVEAQRHADAAQECIDQIASRLAEYNRVMAAAGLLEEEGDLGSATSRLFGALKALHPGLRVTELDELGRGRFKEITRVDAVVGTGAGVLAAEMVATVHLDATRFRSALSAAASLAHDAGSRFAEIVAEEVVRSDIRRAAVHGLEAYAQLALLIRIAPSEDAALRQVMKLYRNLFEDVMAPLVSVMLLASGEVTKPYAKLIAEDATEIARRAAASQVVGPLLAGAEPTYRNAEGHGAKTYRLEGNDVVFELRSFAGRVPVDTVLDDSFALVESLLALQLAIVNAVSVLGYEDHEPADLGYFQPSAVQMVEFLLEDQQISVERLEFSEEAWELGLRDQPPPLFAIAVGLDPHAPDSVRRFVIANHGEGQERTLVIDRRVVAEFLAVDESEPTWRTIVGLARCDVDGAPMLSGDALRCAIAATGVEALVGNRLDRVPRLRWLRGIAMRMGDAAAAELSVAAIRALREGRVAEVARRPEWQAWLALGGVNLP
ncbi:MAG: hypothetical protein KQH57_00715 [Actinomycetales bacterium]|nr:hypothetical protein [Actinomycetales bacterium]